MYKVVVGVVVVIVVVVMVAVGVAAAAAAAAAATAATESDECCRLSILMPRGCLLLEMKAPTPTPYEHDLSMTNKGSAEHGINFGKYTYLAAAVEPGRHGMRHARSRRARDKHTAATTTTKATAATTTTTTTTTMATTNMATTTMATTMATTTTYYPCPSSPDANIHSPHLWLSK